MSEKHQLSLTDLNKNIAMMDQTLFQVIVHQNAIIETLIKKNVISEDEFKMIALKRKDTLVDVINKTLKEAEEEVQEKSTEELIKQL